MPFAGTGLLWLSLSFWVSTWDGFQGSSAKWTLLLGGLSLFNLFAWITGGVAIFNLVTGISENRGLQVVRASAWALVKLSCVGIFIGIFVMRGERIPSISVWMGMGTLVVVPLLGGLLWSQRILRNA